MDSLFRRAASKAIPTLATSGVCDWSEKTETQRRCESDEGIQSTSVLTNFHPCLPPVSRVCAPNNGSDRLPKAVMPSSCSIPSSLVGAMCRVESCFTAQLDGETTAGIHSLSFVANENEWKGKGGGYYGIYTEYSSNSSGMYYPLYDKNTLPTLLYPDEGTKVGELFVAKTSSELVVPKNVSEYGSQYTRHVGEKQSEGVVLLTTCSPAFNLSFLPPLVDNSSLLSRDQTCRGNEEDRELQSVTVTGRCSHDSVLGKECPLATQKALGDSFLRDEVALEGLAGAFSEGGNTAVAILYSKKSFDALKSEGSCDKLWLPMEVLFSSIFSKVHLSSHESSTCFMQVSLTVLKHDQMRDLLPKSGNGTVQPAFYTRADITTSPLYGPCIPNVVYRNISTLEGTRELISASLKGATMDDLLCGVFLVSVILRKLSTDGDDVSVSSMCVVITTAETFHMVMIKRHPPSSASFFRATFQNPQLSMSLVIHWMFGGASVSAEEILFVKEIRRLTRFRSRNLLSARDVTSLRSIIEMSMDRSVSMIIRGGGGFKGGRCVATDESLRCMMLHQGLNRLREYSRDIKLALQAPIGELLQLLKDDEKTYHISENNAESTSLRCPRNQRRKGKRLKCSEDQLERIKGAFCWTPKRIVVNLFACALTAPVSGIMPLFCETSPGSEETHHSKTNPFDDCVYSLVLVEVSKEHGECKPDVVCVTSANCVTVQVLEGSPLKFYPDEVCAQKREFCTGDLVSDEKPNSILLQHAISMFVKGLNTAILLMREGTGDENDFLESPVWQAFQRMVESQIDSLLPSQGLYLSVTQVLSRDCVRDYVASGVGDHQDVVLLPFRAAWTPAGPIVQGAQFVCLKSIEHFKRVVPGLRKNTIMISTSQLRGLNLIFTLLLKRTLTSGAVEPENDTLLSSMTLTIVTSPEAYKSLWIDECVPPDHSKNLYRCAQRCFTLSVTEVSATSLSAVPFLDTQEILRKTRMPHMHRVWTMRQMQQYLAERSALYMRETLSRTGNSCLPLSADERRVIFSDAGVANSHDVAKAWVLVERMRSAIAFLLDSTLSSHPMALVDEDMYDITAPPLSHRHPLNSASTQICSGGFAEQCL